MKKIISSIMLFAAAATAFVSCQKQEVSVSESSREVTLTFASEKPAFDDDTRTEWTGETIKWSAGDRISVAYTVDGVWQNASGDASDDAKLYKSDVLSEAAETAQFNVSTYFKGETDGRHVFYGVYPAPSETDFAGAPIADLVIPPIQNPKADSFDGSADLMIGLSGELDARPGEGEKISLLWNRIVAHAVITLKDINGLTAAEKIENITLTAQEDANLVGKQKVDLITREAVKDNAEANTLKLVADNLSVNDGTVSFWACFLPETLTSLTVKVETDAAIYTREITGISKTFRQNARNTLVIRMNDAVRAVKETDSFVVDVLTREVTGVSGTTYKEWTDKTLTSEAVYAGQSAGGNGSIQMRSNNSNSGIITTSSGGYVKKVGVKWNSNTANGRTLNIYGSTEAYTSPTELYGSTPKGTLIGTIVCGTTDELVIDGDYEYVGMRSASGAMYVEEIEISWAAGAPDTTPKLEVEETTIELPAAASNGTIAVTAKNLASVQARALVHKDAQEESDWLSAEYAEGVVTYTASANEDEKERTAFIEVYALDADGNELVKYVEVIQEAYVDPSVVVRKTIAEFKALADGSTVIYELEGRISQIADAYSEQYDNISFYIVDEAGDEIQIYRMSCVGVTDPGAAITVGDRIVVRGTKGSYGGQSQMAAGGQYVTHEDGSCTPVIVCQDNTVTITADAGATIYYTTNGQTPTVNDAEYTGVFPISSSVTVKAIAVEDGKLHSLVATEECSFIDSSVDQPIEATLSFADKAQRTEFTTSKQVWEQNGIVLTNDKAASTSNVADYANPARFYKSSKITVEAPGNITKIVFDCNSSSYASALKSSITSGGTVSVNSDKVTIVLAQPATAFVIASLSGGQVRMDSLTVTYEN